MNQREADQLLEKYTNGTATANERRLVEAWYQIESDKRPLSEQDDFEHLADELWFGTKERAGLTAPKRSYRLWPRIAAAASIIMISCIAAYFILRPSLPVQQVTQLSKNDLLPGSNRAILTLSNGKQIILNGAVNGQLAKESHTMIDKTSDGKIVYQTSGTEQELKYNTTATPRGGKYNLVLADGTKVWLDAASSITYPIAFTGNNREVKITGQVYFEVAHNAAKPFKVTVNGQTVEVLGTHFNINAYDDEPVMKTTLLEGRVKISKGAESTLLNPGQQAIIAPSANKIIVQEAGIEEATAWKDNHFHFESNDIQTVMRQFARWYNVDVEYEGKIPVRRISGDIDRNSNASVALQILTLLKIHSRIEGNKIIITP